MNILWDGAAIAELLRSPVGPVGIHLQERGTVVQMAAKSTVGVKSGRLQSSIVKRMTKEGTDIGIMVGCDTVPYALMHHNGTDPHVIVPKTAKVLAFKSGGVTVFARKVNHPGTRPNRYLLDHIGLAIS